jgi:hypothetical protein
MFSAVYLVCILGQPCQFFVDNEPYPTLEICRMEAAKIVLTNQERAAKGEFLEHTSEYQCISWDEQV